MRKTKNGNTIHYIAQGHVVGNAWGGGVIGYKAREFKSDKSLKDIKEQIATAFNNGSLDSGFGFESLIAYNMTITKIETTPDNFIRKTYIDFQYNFDDYLEMYEN